MYWSIPCIVLTLHLQTHLFGPLKQALRGRRFTTDQQLNVTLHVWLVCQPKALYSEVIKQIVRWLTECIVKQGDYVEKLCGCNISALVFVNMKHTVRIIIDSPPYIIPWICRMSLTPWHGDGSIDRRIQQSTVWVKWRCPEIGHSNVVKNAWVCTYASQCAFTAWY